MQVVIDANIIVSALLYAWYKLLDSFRMQIMHRKNIRLSVRIWLTMWWATFRR